MEEMQVYSYEQLDREIKRTMMVSANNLVLTGHLLRYMMEEKLWAREHASFDEYLERELHMDYTMATRFIRANKKYADSEDGTKIDPKYRDFSQSVLIEMLNMPPELEKKVTPDMTVKQVREVKRQKKKQDTADQKINELEVATSQQSAAPQEIIDVDYKEVPAGSPATPQYVALTKPDEKHEEYLNAFAKYFISCKKEWMLEDFEHRVLIVTTSPQEIRKHLKPHCRTWNFTINEGAAKINLFDDYVQLFDEHSEYMGDFDWFYLAAAIQRMWNVVALEDAKVTVQEKEQPAAVQDDVEPTKKDNLKETDEIIRIRNILEKEEALLSGYKEAGGIPEDTVYRQKIIVGAIANMICELENMPEKKEQPELPVLKNDSQRKEWLQNYKSWGLWYRDDNIDVNYYKYDFPDGSRLVVEEYPQRQPSYCIKKRDMYYYHMIVKNMEDFRGKVFNDQYCYDKECETFLIEFLKGLQKKGGKKA